MATTSNTISNSIYNGLLYDNGPVKLIDYISDKYNNVHQSLYDKALSLYEAAELTPYGDSLTNYRLYEVPGAEYYIPSSVIMTKKDYPFTKSIVNLSNYWNYYEYNRQSSNTNYRQIKFSEDNIPDLEIIYLDYARGVATLYSKVEDMYVTVDFDMLDAYTPVSSEYTLTNTFTHMLNGK